MAVSRSLELVVVEIVVRSVPVVHVSGHHGPLVVEHVVSVHVVVVPVVVPVVPIVVPVGSVVVSIVGSMVGVAIGTIEGISISLSSSEGSQTDLNIIMIRRR